MMRFHHFVLVLAIVAQMAFIYVFSFNIDTKYPIVFVGPPKSYFGFSVSLLSNRNGPWLIVGAPKADSIDFRNISEPGEIFKCPLNVNSTHDSCDVLHLDHQIGEESSRTEQKDFGWLGVTVDTTQVGDGQVVACGHRWINKKVAKHHFLNGVCYTIDSEFNQTSVNRHLPLTNPADQYFKTGFKYAYAQMGTSAQFVKGSSSLLLGAPGIADWKGSVVRVVQTKPGIETAHPYTVPLNVQQIGYSSFFGYAVTSGLYQRNQEAQFVIGAPRADYRGLVYIVDIINEKFIVKVEKTGVQMGEYFGSSVCAVDFNDDQLDDLMVGAPLFRKPLDEGRVYVYQNKGFLLLELVSTLMGSSIPRSRFGSSITNIGDVNRDGYSDVAIGAPYENGRGAIYIYHGGPDGLSQEYKQRITAEEVSNVARGFGMSISRGMDVDNNNFLDIVVGAYDSDQAFLLRSQPLIKLSGKITHSIQVLDADIKNCFLDGTNITCFNVTTCLSYNGQSVPSSINVTSNFEVDILKRDARVVFHTVTGEKASIVTRTLQLTPRVDHCTDFTLYVLKTPDDIIAPIQMKLSYNLLEKPSNTFGSEWPVLESKSDISVNSEVHFLRHCKSRKCLSDLQLRAAFKDFESGSRLVVGSRANLVLQVEVYNAAEPAYVTRISLIIPNWIDVNMKPPMCDFHPQDQLQYKLLNCLVANPLKSNNTVKMDFNLNIQRIPLKEGQLEMNVTVDSDSDDITPNDNVVHLTHPIILESDIHVTGSTDNGQVLYLHDGKGKVANGTKATFSHSHVISNSGPSKMDSLTVEVRYPSPWTSSGSKIIEIESVHKLNGEGGGVFGLCESTIAPNFGFQLDHSVVSGNRQTDSAINDTYPVTDQGGQQIFRERLHLNCSSNYPCDTYKCSVGSVSKNTRATLTITFKVDIHELKNVMGDLDSALVTSEGKVYPSQSTKVVQPVDHKPDETTISTEIKPSGPLLTSN